MKLLEWLIEMCEFFSELIVFTTAWLILFSILAGTQLTTFQLLQVSVAFALYQKFFNWVAKKAMERK
jgi:hypothetical protein